MFIPVHLSNQTIFAQLKISNRAKNIRLTIKENSVVIAAPYGVHLSIIHRFLEQKTKWLEKHIVFTPRTPLFQWNSTFEILGQAYTLKNCNFPLKKIVYEGDHVLWVNQNIPQAKNILAQFCKEKALSFFTSVCTDYANRLKIDFDQIKVRHMTSRWGSCSSTRNLNFNWRLVFAPKEIAMYVAAHEVAHLKEMNHSPRFWKIVSDLHPDYKNARQWLNNQGKTLINSPL